VELNWPFPLSYTTPAVTAEPTQAQQQPPPHTPPAPSSVAKKKDTCTRREQWKRRRARTAKAGDGAEEEEGHDLDSIEVEACGERSDEDDDDVLCPPSAQSPPEPIGIQSSPPTPRARGDVIGMSRTSSSRGGGSDGDASSGRFVWADVEEEEVGCEVAVAVAGGAVGDASSAAAAAVGGGGGGKRAKRRHRNAAEKKAAAAAEVKAAADAAAVEVAAAHAEAEAERAAAETAAAEAAAGRREEAVASTRYDHAGAGAMLLALLQAGPQREEQEEEEAVEEVEEPSDAGDAASVHHPSGALSLERHEVNPGGFDAEAARRFLAERTPSRRPLCQLVRASRQLRGMRGCRLRRGGEAEFALPRCGTRCGQR
jgi:hypothetical protein